MTRPAPLLLHDRQYVLQAAHITHEFELQRLRPMLFAQELEYSTGRRSGVVDQDIDAPKRGVSILDKGLGIGRLGKISRYGDDFAICLAPIWDAVASSGSLRRAQIATSTPSRAKAKAIALPIPALAPVTSAVLPFIWRSMRIPVG